MRRKQKSVFSSKKLVVWIWRRYEVRLWDYATCFFPHKHEASVCTDMATVAARGIGIGVIKLHPHNSSKPTSPFLGKKLRIKPAFESQPSKRITISNPKTFLVSAAGGELINVVHDLFLGVGVGLPCTVMECGDIIYRSTLPKSNGLTLTTTGAVLALGALSYLWATPGVAPGFFDMFVLAFVERLFRPTYRKVCDILYMVLHLGSGFG